MKTTKKKLPTQYLLLITLSITMPLVAFELLYLLIRHDTEPSYVFHLNDTCDRYWTYPGNSVVKFTNSIGEKIQFTSDFAGFRNSNSDWNNPEIVILGDSFSTALNTKDSDTLSAFIKNEGNSVLNLGMDGFSTWNSIAVWKQFKSKLNPKVVLLLFFLGNDFRDNLTMLNDYSNNECTTEFAKRLSLWGRSILHKSILFELFRNTINSIWINSIERERSYPWIELEHLLKPDSQIMTEARANTAHAIKILKNLVESNGSHLVVIGIPAKSHVARSLNFVHAIDRDPLSVERVRSNTIHPDFKRPNTDIQSIATQASVSYIDFFNKIKDIDEKEIFYPDDFHWNSKGQKLAAEEFIKFYKKK